ERRDVDPGGPGRLEDGPTFRRGDGAAVDRERRHTGIDIVQEGSCKTRMPGPSWIANEGNAAALCTGNRGAGCGRPGYDGRRPRVGGTARRDGDLVDRASGAVPLPRPCDRGATVGGRLDEVGVACRPLRRSA